MGKNIELASENERLRRQIALMKSNAASQGSAPVSREDKQTRILTGIRSSLNLLRVAMSELEDGVPPTPEMREDIQLLSNQANLFFQHQPKPASSSDDHTVRHIDPKDPKTR